ncbi:hypothetical protein CTEN210_18268 [Chaetoceros tenuissimus]|uniref:Uncharacterized protein n=1 Tax=Chaetoceros tenuissimus TaxID=426638 RepID=A0AAD3DD53_9STRA|nr:hypothetical protein CTEN210_18268 [Chaetoceros tenuissimus]
MYHYSFTIFKKNKLIANRILSSSEQEDAKNKLKEQNIHHVINKGGLQIVLPFVIDETPQEILTELFGNPKSVFQEKHRDCKATSQVKITFGTNKDEPVIFSTFDANGMEKKQGGDDELYITYSGSNDVNAPDAIAHVKDLQNGQYELEFVQPFLPFEVERLERDILPGGIFTVVLQYTCGLGSYMPPTKQSWDQGGAINSKWEAKVPDNFLPPIVMARDRPKPQSFGEELTSYRAIYAIGDSTMRMFMGGYYPGLDNMITPRRENFGNIHSSEGGSVAGVGMPLSSNTLDKFIGIAKWLVREQGIEGDDGKDYALLIGSGVWDLLANNDEDQPNFYDHLKALREFISVVKGLTSAKVYWKSMTAVHVHRVLMKELDILVLDMYNFTYEAASQTVTKNPLGDARHYDGIFNGWMMDYFYPAKKGMAEMHLSDSQHAVVERLV